MFIAVYFNNYFIRGTTRFSSIIAMLTMIATFITVYFGKAYVLEIFIPITILAVIFFTIFGKWDYSSKGTRTPETKKYWESDFGIAPWISLYNMVEKIAEKQGIEEDEDFKQMKAWLNQIYINNKFKEMIKEDLAKK
jgi:hypothetical protein